MIKYLEKFNKIRLDYGTSYTFATLFVVLVNIYYTTKGWTFSGPLVNVLLLIGIFFGIIDIIVKFHKSKVYIVLGLALVIVLSQFLVNKDTRLMVALIGVCVAMNTPLKHILKCLFVSKLFSFLFCFVIGGYTHLNYDSINIGLILLLFSIIYYRKKALAFKISLILFLVGYFISKSGAFLLCTMFAIILFYILNEKCKNILLSLKLINYFLPIILLINVVLCWLYVIYVNPEINFPNINHYTPSFIVMILSSILKFVNSFFNERINLGGVSLYHFGISLFGGNVDYSVDLGLPYFLVDSGLILLLQNWGILVTILINVMFVYLMKRLREERKYSLLVYSIIILIWSFNEDVLISIGTNFMFYFLGNQLRRDGISFFDKRKYEKT